MIQRQWSLRTGNRSLGAYWLAGDVRLDDEKQDNQVGEHGQITNIWPSDRCGGEIIPMTAKIGYCPSRFEGYL